MNLYLLVLVSLASAVDTTSPLLSLDVNANTTLPLVSLDYAYRCASQTPHQPGRRTPTALDCLNVLTYMLATTANHDQPTEWTRNPASGQMPLPYRRSSGSCQLYIQLTQNRPGPTIETASFDQVIGAAMRIIEVCLLNGRPDVKQWGGAAVVGLSGFLDVVVWGTPISGGDEGVQSNETVDLSESGQWVTEKY